LPITHSTITSYRCTQRITHPTRLFGHLCDPILPLHPTAGRVGPCDVTIAITVTGPGPIINNQFSRTVGNYSFSGQFSSPVNSAGWYTFTNYYIYGCGYLNQVGTWTAGRP